MRSGGRLADRVADVDACARRAAHEESWPASTLKALTRNSAIQNGCGLQERRLRTWSMTVRTSSPASAAGYVDRQSVSAPRERDIGQHSQSSAIMLFRHPMLVSLWKFVGHARDLCRSTVRDQYMDARHI